MLLSIGYICNTLLSAGKMQEVAEHEVRHGCCIFWPAICGNDPEKNDCVAKHKSVAAYSIAHP